MNYLSASTWVRTLTAACAALLIVGCASTKLPEDPALAKAPVVSSEPAKRADTVTTVAPPTVSKVVAQHPLDDPQSPLKGRTVYFDYDSAIVSSVGATLLEAHGKYLRSQASAKVQLQGHADERGGREYNLALGQKRADAVRQSLKLQGVSEAQMESVSYGKEKPVALGHDEESWSKNRRVEIIYQAR